MDNVQFTRDDSDRLVRVESNMQAHVDWEMDVRKQTDEKLDKIISTLEKQNGRIGKVERKQSWMTGVGGAVVAIFGALFGLK